MARLVVTFNGNNGAGAISIATVKAGDVVVFVIDSAGHPSTVTFASFIATDGELLQTGSGDQSGATFTALLTREVEAS